MPRSTQAAEDKSELEAYIEAHHAMIRMIKELLFSIVPHPCDVGHVVVTIDGRHMIIRFEMAMYEPDDLSAP